ncbi:uroporphyrin-III C-methyltransferase [Pseudarcicella hirudinis]|uniref:uroporphyrinogen-III C-methyltransferase n=1 Tax=Pseudarcicella hirudinis TaxID=1079859 RepID=A0A1I5QFM6_9BACT|nr:uroporphyrinogen-III C-methyltransferase [Pseudarcicella hirudinis]SFP45099.1 uroporphyrin-III C-methyltransferase [Pseudarcicella hirudinis]
MSVESFNNLVPIPKLTVVGAGPGDPDLITMKAVKVLQSADVVLYDALIAEEILSYCKPGAEKIYVGKRPGESHSQDSINFLIVEKAYMHGHVVRLKGGDPFIFGRGQEEIEYARQFDLETAYVPGISSSVAAAGYAGIPMTARGVSESFWVITGTKSDGSLSSDLATALQTTATIVILMGMNKLWQIAEVCEDMGKGNLPVAIIQNGTTKQEKTGLGLARNLPEIAKENKLSNPAVIVLGEVVRYADTTEIQKIYKHYQG